MLTRHPLTERHKQEICSWQYPEPYAAYNLPPYEIMQEKQSGFMNPDREKDYHGFSLDGTFVGYANLREKPDGIFIGIGVHPDFCDKGIGRRILQMITDLCPGKRLYLIVRTWNQRAIRCYERAGFRIVTAPYIIPNRGTFYKMTHT